MLQSEYLLKPRAAERDIYTIILKLQKIQPLPYKMLKLISARSSYLQLRNRKSSLSLTPRKFSFFHCLLDSSFKKLLATNQQNNIVSPLGGVVGIKIQLEILLL